MTELLTAAQMRAIEIAAIESGEVTGLELMERAGQGVVEAVFEEWPELAGTAHRAVVLCGPGNNGGDGFVVARLLKEWGWEVEVFLYGDAEKLPPDARANYERWREKGDTLGLSSEMPRWEGDYWKDSDLDLLVDAVFGTGLARSVEGQLAELFSAINVCEHGVGGARTVAVDIPSGLDGDSGKVLGSAIQADLSVSFHSLKAGHLQTNGPDFCGRSVVKSIGLEATRAATDARKELGRGVVQFVEHPGLAMSKLGAHKYSHGHALILSGGASKSGAARLAAQGALRIGAGLVTLGVPHEAQAEVAAQITALMMCEVGDAGALSVVLRDTRLNALCLGPGLGAQKARDLVPAALGASGVKPRPTVLDADALSAFSDAPDELFGMLHGNCVLTPHEGEFARLFPDIAMRLREEPRSGPAFSKADATREAATRAGCVVLFKGPDTVIADPTGRCSLNSAHYDRAAPWLATAGSGDVLAGFITGLLARGFAPMHAAENAAYLHVECARHFGPGLIAEDLPEQLPAVFRDLGI
ncbi:yjeF C-terminal region, hydroxyethylthiazole kinase-related/yjeF N-terminal region [Shimia gijangensis]|uniref:Bifunctional NAD(P)H-hydrate repair enzyme n=1 Tax=Shimia gijangensis TaxID=1470563 RepID=A0A1M6EC87_9RHOB|nr:bifunctional ADP-dependent NAD(P)H-hydrate dehydratase/NAD(P)H-hydrate epimerase [Shimia gijangensis]SHI83084.1 yjeF C-terminal region, hydroxyethylthiazole kinase-related/yjeF N-terminal region [Shimia gijangensis]